ncbi:MAG: hypothetical protein C0410_14340 [Anaerolinea sp.]|nr:hypothetical protein [Anaerolinea sp.]
MKTPKIVKQIIFLSGCILTLFVIFVVVEVVIRVNYAKEYRLLEIKEEQTILNIVSKKTGEQFDDWQSLREYVYCGDLIKKGMTKEQVEESLSLIGEIRIGPDYIEFKNEYLFDNLSPTFFSYVDGELDSWWRATGEFTKGGDPMASCQTL